MEDEDLLELEEQQAVGVDRSPGAVSRAKRARGHFASGTILPRLQGLLNPGLFRERGDTNRLVESVLGEEGALARLAMSNPDLAQEIRQQADTPMSSAEHEKFRSTLLGMVGDEVKRNERIKYQLADNQSFFDAFSTLRGFVPGYGNDEVDTREEYELREVQTLYKQAQAAALTDPDHSAAIMGEVRKKADALTANVRTDMEKQRKVARAEDGALWATARERLSETDDVIASLQDDLDKKGLRRDPSPVLIARANALLGQASDIPAAGFSEAADTAASMVPQAEGGAGNLLGEGIRLAGKATDKALAASDVQYLIQRLQFNRGLLQQSYTNDRLALADKWKASGLQFGNKAGEVYSVPSEAYKREAEKIEAAPKKPTDDVDTLRGMLTDEVASAQAAVDKTKPEASANLPGAAARFATATARLQMARDDADIFEADQQEAAANGQPVERAPDAAANLLEARKRRAARQSQRDSGLVRKATMEALRRYTR